MKIKIILIVISSGEDKIILIVMSSGETAAVRVCKSDKSFEGRHWGELAVF